MGAETVGTWFAWSDTVETLDEIGAHHERESAPFVLRLSKDGSGNRRYMVRLAHHQRAAQFLNYHEYRKSDTRRDFSVSMRV